MLVSYRPLVNRTSYYLRHPSGHVDGLEPSSRFVAAVLARGVDAGHLALDVQRRPALAPQQPTDGLVERTVPKLFRPEIDASILVKVIGMPKLAPGAVDAIRA